MSISKYIIMEKIFIYLFFCLGFFCLVHVECKFGRGGGGSFRSMGSRFNNRLKPQPRPNPYYFNNRKSGIRWGSFGAGMAAYGIMSSLTHRGNFHQGYYGRPEYHHQRNGSMRKIGNLCVNNEDFNGTKFGSFYCPLPGFNPAAKYCCGEPETQYCCEYFDDNGRKNGVIIAVICVIGILICLVGCATRFYLSNKKNTFPKSPSTYARQFHHYNRNYGPSQMGNPMRPPMANRMSAMNKSAPYPTQVFASQTENNQSAPYPTQPLMPQPNLAKTEVMPPLYSEAVKN
ncbi:collagen alpha-1(II) chain-like isoform X3 [Brachionus plicatilis]|uniref:Collagen alpha-1(II) chain-like isoform X3 n=1 Tax=Brachionus plicatilis TaxID=10195 RepID=A0A3M7P1T3_BRAPC|nr:collagen alpha-1(II) chain-like isoform X3 [Brachionus plicatilis]